MHHHACCLLSLLLLQPLLLWLLSRTSFSQLYVCSLETSVPAVLLDIGNEGCLHDEQYTMGVCRRGGSGSIGAMLFVFGAYFGMTIGVDVVAYRKKRATEDDAELRAHHGGTYHPCL